MNVLVTGGAGYIGSVVTAELLRAGHSPVVYDDLSRGHREAVAAGVPLVTADTANRKQLELTFRKYAIDAVMHFAASIDITESMRLPEKYFRNNTANTLTLLEAMHAVGVKKLIFSSTAALYGDPDSTPIPETASPRPASVYGESKLLAEQILSWFNKIHGLRYASLRYFNAAGATETLGEAHDPETHLIPIILQVAARQREAISIFGTDYPTDDGTCVRDYIHVLDLADAHLRALAALDHHPCLIFNVGNGRGFSVREVIESARRVTGHAIPVVEAPRRAGDSATLVASSEKIQTELQWKPRFPSLDQIVSSAWAWHQKFPSGY